ncbi:hypothetical protein BH10ACT7_BH10ACT7_23570 [soil metagenome]
MVIVALWALAPVLRLWVASKMDEVDGLPRPSDVPEWRSSGPNADRVLIFGGGPAVGWGVLSHALALPGSLGRVLSSQTNRGAEISAVPVPRLKIRGALGALDGVELDQYDAIVVTVGVNDAGALTSLKTWEQGLSELLRTMVRRCAPNAQIYVAGVHPVRSIRVFDSPLGSVADAHARRMNDISARICDRLPNTTYVPLTAPEPTGTVRFRDANSYRHWAQELAAVMAPQLE